MKLGLIQTNPIFGDIKGNTNKAIEQILKIDADLIVLPELFSTGYQFKDKKEAYLLAEEIPHGPTTKTIAEIAKSQNNFIIFGIAEKDNNKIFNSAVIVGPFGFIGTYRKSHLFFKETLIFNKGDTGYKVIDIGITKIGIIICYDWRFPEPSRILSLGGAEIICHPSNLVLPHGPSGMVTRSIENRVFSITANRIGAENRIDNEKLSFIGKSQVVDPNGEILYRAPDNKEVEWVINIDQKKARDKNINELNDLFKDIRRDLIV